MYGFVFFPWLHYLQYLQMDLPNFINIFLCSQCISCEVLPHSSLLSIYNIQRWRWEISKETFKRWLTNRSVDCFIIILLYLDNIFILGLQMLLILTPQNMHQIFIDYFWLRICLWMECCISIQLSAHLLPQCHSKCIERYGIFLHSRPIHIPL